MINRLPTEYLSATRRRKLVLEWINMRDGGHRWHWYR